MGTMSGETRGRYVVGAGRYVVGVERYVWGAGGTLWTWAVRCGCGAVRGL